MSASTLFLLYNEFWARLPEPPASPNPPCRVTTDRRCLDEADAVVFHMPNLDTTMMPVKRPGQLWVGWSMESEVYYPRLDDPAFAGLFDLLVGHRRTADVWHPYLGFEFLARFDAGCREREGGVVYCQSNDRDRSGRRDYVRRLMRRVKIDSYGRSLNNSLLVEDDGNDARLALFARYKFTLAFENSIAVDYVTEKFFDPLAVGSVPVYRGAPNVADFAPAADCYIDAATFGTPEDLAAYLDHLLATPRAYEALLAWRKRGFSSRFAAALDTVKVSPWLRLAALVDERRSDAAAGTRRDHAARNRSISVTSSRK